MNQYLQFVKNWPQVHKAIRSDIMMGEAAEEIHALSGLYYEISGDGRGAGHTDRRNRRATKETLHLQSLPCPKCGTKPEQPGLEIAHLDALKEALVPLAVLKLTDSEKPYAEFSPELRASLLKAHDLIMSALAKVKESK